MFDVCERLFPFLFLMRSCEHSLCQGKRKTSHLHNFRSEHKNSGGITYLDAVKGAISNCWGKGMYVDIFLDFFECSKR